MLTGQGQEKERSLKKERTMRKMGEEQVSECNFMPCVASKSHFDFHKLLSNPETCFLEQSIKRGDPSSAGRGNRSASLRSATNDFEKGEIP